MESRLILDVGELRRLRKSQALSQESLAYACEQRQLRVSIATIKRAESGKPVSYRTARELARYFGVELKQIVQDSGGPGQLAGSAAPGPGEGRPEQLTLLWLRLDTGSEISRIISLLERRGSVWHEQLGNVVLAAFGNFRLDGKGHLHAQNVALEIRRWFESANAPEHFYAALQPGSLSQNVGRTELSPRHLQWFARQATRIPANTVVVSSDLYRMSSNYFSYEPLHFEDDSLWLLSDAICLEKKLPLVGRNAEILQINAILDGVGQRREPAVAHVTGPAGIGKSRLLAAVHEQARLREILIAAIDLENGWGEPGQLLANALARSLSACIKTHWPDKKLRERLFNDNYSVTEQLVFAELFGMTPSLDSRAQHWETVQAVDEEARVRAIASILSTLLDERLHSFLITVDNLHLASSSGHRWFTRLVEMCRSLPLTCIVTSRVESDTGEELNKLATEGISLSTISLGPLAPAEVNTICEAFDGLESSYKQRCTELAEGVPLYLIQLLTNASGRGMKMPSSLKLLVEHKLSSLDGGDRRVVEFLSVCDIPVPLADVGTMLGLQDYSPRPLVAAQLIRVDDELRVKLCHELVRRIVYQSLPDHIGRAHHRLVAEYIEERFDDSLTEEAVTLAAHLEAAGEPFKAAQYHYHAAAQMLRSGLYDEAQGLLNRAMDGLESGAGDARDELEINVQLALSSVYKVKYGWVSPLLKSTYQRIEHLCRRKEPDRRLAMALFGLWSIELVTLNFRQAELIAQRCLDISKELGDPQGETIAHSALCNTLFWRGLHRQSVQAAGKALATYQPEFQAPAIELLGQDPRALADCFGALSASLLGERDQAKQYRNRMLEQMRDLRHDFSLAIAMQGSAWVDYHHGDAQGALAQATALEELSDKMGFPFYRGVASLFLGWARHKLFRDAEAATLVDTGYHRWLASSGDKIAYSLYCTILGEILVDSGRTDEARGLLETGIDFSIEHDEACYLPEMYRLLSRCVEGEERRACLCRGLQYTQQSPLFAARIEQDRFFQAFLDHLDLGMPEPAFMVGQAQGVILLQTDQTRFILDNYFGLLPLKIKQKSDSGSYQQHGNDSCQNNIFTRQ